LAILPQALEERRRKHAERKAARAAKPQSNSITARIWPTLSGRSDGEGDDRSTSRGRDMVRHVSKGLSKGLNDAGKAARSMAERSFSLGRSTSRGRPEIEDGRASKTARRSSKTKSKRRRRSKSLTEHLHRKPIHKRSDLDELNAFLASGGLEYLAPQFASAGLLKKKQLLALNHVVRDLSVNLLLLFS